MPLTICLLKVPHRLKMVESRCYLALSISYYVAKISNIYDSLANEDATSSGNDPSRKRTILSFIYCHYEMSTQGCFEFKIGRLEHVIFVLKYLYLLTQELKHSITSSIFWKRGVRQS